MCLVGISKKLSLFNIVYEASYYDYGLLNHLSVHVVIQYQIKTRCLLLGGPIDIRYLGYLEMLEGNVGYREMLMREILDTGKC